MPGPQTHVPDAKDAKATLKVYPARALRIRYRQPVMPHDDAPLRLKPAASAQAQQTASVADLEVMTRVLRLPTQSMRLAKAMVKMQLDRLSPLPVSETAYDLALLRPEGSDGVFALGITRRASMLNEAFGNQRKVSAVRQVDGASVVFRFRNPDGVNPREQRLLRHAPEAALVALGLTAVLLAGAYRAEQWRAQRLPELAAAQREVARAQREADEMTGARAEWVALSRADAATRLLCVTERVRGANHGAIVPVLSLGADSKEVVLRLAGGASPDPLIRAGSKGDTGSEGGAAVTFGEEVCS